MVLELLSDLDTIRKQYSTPISTKLPTKNQNENHHLGHPQEHFFEHFFQHCSPYWSTTPVVSLKYSLPVTVRSQIQNRLYLLTASAQTLKTGLVSIRWWILDGVLLPITTLSHASILPSVLFLKPYQQCLSFHFVSNYHKISYLRSPLRYHIDHGRAMGLWRCHGAGAFLHFSTCFTLSSLWWNTICGRGVGFF